MSRAQVKFEANETFAINGVNYRVAQHPALPGIPYVQRGARGFVVQLIRPDGERMALKYFKLKYRVPELVEVAKLLSRYADLPGMRAARRTVFTRADHAAFVDKYPALEYGMMMPWLPGLTWYDLVTTKAPLTPAEGLRLAQKTGDILASLEGQNVAHCDIAGANVMIDRKTGQVELVDIEEMYGPGLPEPVEPPAGQDGYQHRTSRQQGQWHIEGDRFGAAVLLAEILTWPDGRVRVYSADEHFFATAEMQDQESVRYKLICEVLHDRYGAEVEGLFRSAWLSDTLAECPPLVRWRDALGALQVVHTEQAAHADARSAQSADHPISPSAGMPVSDTSVVSRRRTIALPSAKGKSGPQPESIPSGDVQGDHGADRVHLEGVRLCRNCGEPNDTRASFCKRCGFYIGVGARKPVAVQMPLDRGPGAKGATPSAVPVARPVPPPQAIPLNRNLNEVISARRVGDPGKGMQRIETPKPLRDQAEGNAGSWIVVALIIGFVLAVLLLALIAR
jgi:hypothetical protein